MPLSFASLYVLWYHFSVRECARVQCQSTHWNTVLVEKAKLAHRQYSPTIWGINRHSQTITCTIVSLMEWIWSKPIFYKREEIRGWDGNLQHLDWVEEVLPDNLADAQPICILVHGLGDDRFHPTVMRMARICINRGWRVVVWSYWRFDFSESRDLEGVLQHIGNKAPHSPLIAVGWSAGGHLLLNYLGAVGKNTPLVCAAAISPATDFVQHGKILREEENLFYMKFMGINVQKCLRRHVHNDSRIKDRQAFLSRFSMFDLDALNMYDTFLHTSPSDTHLGDFTTRRRKSMEAGARQSTKSSAPQSTVFENYPKAAQVIESIKIPLLVVMAEDDPVSQPHPSTLEEFQRNRHVILLTTQRGGHVGFYDGFLPFGSTFDARCVTDYVGAVLETLSHTSYILNIMKEAARQGILGDASSVTKDEGGHEAFKAAGPSATLGPSAASTLQALGPVMMRRIASDTNFKGLALDKIH